MKALYQALIAQLKPLGYKWIDIDSGQLDQQDHALKFPCALVSISSTPKDVTESSDQYDSLTVRIRLAWDATGSRTSADTPETVLNRSLAWIDTADATYTALQGFSPIGMDSFECTSKGQEDRRDGLVVFRMMFTTGMFL